MRLYLTNEQAAACRRGALPMPGVVVRIVDAAEVYDDDHNTVAILEGGDRHPHHFFADAAAAGGVTRAQIEAQIDGAAPGRSERIHRERTAIGRALIYANRGR
jgi:hypothetical protein